MTLREADERVRKALWGFLKPVLTIGPGLLVAWGIATFATGDRPLLGAFIVLGFIALCAGIGFVVALRRSKRTSAEVPAATPTSSISDWS